MSHTPLYGTHAYRRMQDDPPEPVCSKCGSDCPDYEGNYGDDLCEDCYAIFCANYDFENDCVKDAAMVNHARYIQKKLELCEEIGVNPIMETLKSVFGK